MIIYGPLRRRDGEPGLWVQEFTIWTQDGKRMGLWRWLRAEDRGR